MKYTEKLDKVLSEVKEDFESSFNEVIEKRGDKWVVLTKDRSKVLGTHNTKTDAIKQLQAIEISKHK